MPEIHRKAEINSRRAKGMGKIIQFQQRKEQKAVSNGYDNLSRLIAIAATKGHIPADG